MSAAAPYEPEAETPIFEELLAELGPVVQAAHLAVVEAQAETDAAMGSPA